LKETIRKAAAHLVVQRQARKLAAEKRRVRFEFISVLGPRAESAAGGDRRLLNIIASTPFGENLPRMTWSSRRCLVRAAGTAQIDFWICWT